ncbi:MAG: glutathione S-transferase family protein [Nitratireductor sp.]|nr:glutathione S-transferase family protein [Nitratireductor sp.]
MYKLIGSPTTRAFRVLWMLEELGVAYELERAGPRSEAILAVNPAGKVPALLADGEAIIDSVAIIQFLADRHGRFTFPAGSIKRAQQDSFTQFACDDLDGACWNYAKHSFILPEALRVPEAKPAFAHDFAKAMSAFEQRLGDRQFVMGDEFTVPDLLIAHTAGWAKSCKFPWPEGKVTDYFERVRARPAFLKAMEIREAGKA